MAEAALQIGPGKRSEFAVHPRRELLKSGAISLRPAAEEERQGDGFHQKHFGTVSENFRGLCYPLCLDSAKESDEGVNLSLEGFQPVSY